MPTTTPTDITLHLVIHGKVQGVFFRDSMRREAERLQLKGWVKNLADGSVEAMIQGHSAAVDQLVQWAYRGPTHARVDKVDITPGSGRYHQFEIIY